MLCRQAHLAPAKTRAHAGGSPRQMPIDADLLDQAKAAEGRVIDTEHAAELARCDSYRAVRRLQLAGASLREITNARPQPSARPSDREGGRRSRRWRNRLVSVGEPRSAGSIKSR